MKKLLIAVVTASTVGCATLTEEAMTPIALSFSDGSNGKCQLMNKRGAWPTDIPTTISVRKSDDALKYQCETKDGREAVGSIASEMGAKIIASALFIDFGITDAITDKHRKYAESFVIPIAQVAPQQSESKPFSVAAQPIVTDQALLAKIAVQDRRLTVRLDAIAKVTDQTLVQQWAKTDPQAAIRQAAIKRVADDKFLVQRLGTEPSASVRSAIVQTLHENDSLSSVARNAYHQNDRMQALLRLKKISTDIGSDVEAEHKALARRVNALATENDNDKLLTLSLEGEFDVLRTTAASRLSDPLALEYIASHAMDRDVLKIMLPKLADQDMLNRVAAKADDRAMRLAAEQKSGAKSWQEIFDAATAKGATTQMLGDALAAASLFPEVQRDAKSGVQYAALNLIRRGDESRIPEMVDLLAGYGDKKLAEDYLNCGQPDLNVTGRSWAGSHGYFVGTGSGSHRATWGNDR